MSLTYVKWIRSHPFFFKKKALKNFKLKKKRQEKCLFSEQITSFFCCSITSTAHPPQTYCCFYGFHPPSPLRPFLCRMPSTQEGRRRRNSSSNNYDPNRISLWVMLAPLFQYPQVSGTNALQKWSKKSQRVLCKHIWVNKISYHVSIYTCNKLHKSYGNCSYAQNLDKVHLLN